MSWSDDGKSICFPGSSKKVFIMSVTLGTADSDPIMETRTEISMKSSTNGPILQLMFQDDSSHLLIYTSSTICTVSLMSSSVAHSLEWDRDDCRWITHPQDPTLIAGVGPRTLYTFNWDLVEQQSYSIDVPFNHNMSPGRSSDLLEWTIDRVLIAHDRKHVFIQISASREKTFLYLESASFLLFKTEIPALDHEKDRITLNPIIVPRALSSQIAAPLSILSRDRLIFLSRTFSVCSLQLHLGSFQASSSYPLSASSASRSNIAATTTKSITTLSNHHRSGAINDTADRVIKEFFSLPADWISKDCLALGSIWIKERSFLCPRNGELALVRSSALV